MKSIGQKINSKIVLERILHDSFKFNSFNQFLINRLLESNRGVGLKLIYSDYRKASNYTINNHEVSMFLEDFYDSVRDTEMFLLKKEFIKPFPKTSYMSCFEIKSEIRA